MPPLRVLHVLGTLNVGGIETWLMHVLRHADPDRLRIDLLTHSRAAAVYEEEARRLGARVLPCESPQRPLQYSRSFRGILQSHGPYDAVHTHVHHFSGYVLRLAREAGIPMRIAHSHGQSGRGTGPLLLRRAYLPLMRRWVHEHATLGLAVSRQAADALFGRDWQRDPRWRVLYCGIDLSPFQAPVDRAQVRCELGIPADAFVVGHVGSFVPVKNHLFLLEVAAELRRRSPAARLLLVGDGPLREEIARRATEAGLSEVVRFAGLRRDVPRLMLGALDAFILPSHSEGLPLVGLEAQAAGLPLALADHITDEVDIVKPLVRRLSLSQPAAAWADALVSARPNPGGQPQALSLMEQSPFSIGRSIAALERVYAGEA